MRITEYLDRIASALEDKGLLLEAHEIDIIANTLDLMTQHAPVSERERNEEFNYALQHVQANPVMAKRGLINYWGPQWGETIFNIAQSQLAAGRSQNYFPQWQRATMQAKQEKSRKTVAQPVQDDPFLSPTERAKAKRQEPAEESPFTRS
jgi:hypothetical protein